MENMNLSPKKNQIIFSRKFFFGIFFPAWSDVSPTEDSAKLVSLSLDLGLSWWFYGFDPNTMLLNVSTWFLFVLLKQERY